MIVVKTGSILIHAMARGGMMRCEERHLILWMFRLHQSVLLLKGYRNSLMREHIFQRWVIAM